MDKKETNKNKKIFILLLIIITLFAIAYLFDYYVSPIQTGPKEMKQEMKESNFVINSVALPVNWNDLGKQMIEKGVIDKEKFLQIYESRGGLSNSDLDIFEGENNNEIIINKENANFVLNLFWAFGLSNKNEILTQGEMSDPKYGGAGRFASTGGWTLSVGGSMNHYSKYNFVELNQDQQNLVEKVSKNIYRPCCGNSTHFPDCNHGMAMLGLLELLAANNVGEKQMYEIALDVNSLWFPETYQVIDQYLQSKGSSLKNTDPKIILGKEYSSGVGYQRILAELQPKELQGGGSCGV